MEAIYTIAFFVCAFLPMMTAITRKHRSRLAIGFMDFLSLGILIGSAFMSLAGASIIGFPLMLIAIVMWIWAMIWSLTGNVEVKA